MAYNIDQIRKRLNKKQDSSFPILKSPNTDELDRFDWFNFVSTAPEKPLKPQHISIMNISGEETEYERKMRMLRQLSQTCLACSMCELGRKPAERNNELRDPHVFSNMNPQRFMVVDQNPGWDEIKERVPFTGVAGKNFDDELKKNGFNRNDFYICNAVRCFTNDVKPTSKHRTKCEPFLQMEISLIKPSLVITLGETAFSQFCPNNNYEKALKKITKSEKYGVSVFAIYHPSSPNFTDANRRRLFSEQMAVLCKLINAIKAKH